MARKLFEKQGVRTRAGTLATGTVYVVYSDVAATVLADISTSSGGSSIAGSTVTVADLPGLGLATLKFYGPPAGTDTLYLRCPADPTLGVQEIEADEDERLDALEAGGGALGAGSFPQTFSGVLVGTGTVANVGANNRGYYMLVTEGPTASISSLVVNIGVSSGNVCVAVFSSTGSGRSRVPASRTATSGAVASPGTGERTIALGGSVTVTPFETWLFVSADNTTVSVSRATTGAASAAGTVGLAWQQEAAHPAPVSAGTLAAAASVFWIAGV